MAYTYTILTGAKTVDGSIKNWLNNSRIPSTSILTEAEAWIYQRLRAREMIASATVAFVAGDSTKALPASFLEPISLRPYGWGEELPYVHETLLRRDRNSAGALYSATPSEWSIIDNLITLDSACSAALSCDFIYYKQPDALAGGNETNFLTSRFPTLLRMACMARAYEWLKQQDQATGYINAALGEIEAANATADAARRGQWLR